MVKKKRVIIICTIIVLIVVLVLFLFRTPSAIQRMKNEVPYGISVLESTYGDTLEDIKMKKCYITDKNKKEQLLELLLGANFNYNYSGIEGVSFSGAVSYSIYIEYVTKNGSEYSKIDIVVYGNRISVNIDGKDVSIGLLTNDKYEGEKVEFIEKFKSMVEEDLEIWK